MKKKRYRNVIIKKGVNFQRVGEMIVIIEVKSKRGAVYSWMERWLLVVGGFSLPLSSTSSAKMGAKMSAKDGINCMFNEEGSDSGKKDR